MTAAATLRPFLQILHERCIRCGACIAVCLPESLVLRRMELRFHSQTCTKCVECFRICPAAALAPASGRYYKGVK